MPAVSWERCAPYESESLFAAVGHSMHPGGLDLTDRALSLVALDPGARVLDVGCGCGTTVAHLATCHGLDAVGLDPSARLLDLARNRFPSLLLLRGDAERLPVLDCSLDAIVAECSLSLVGDLATALSGFHRTLTQGGFLIVSDLYVREPNRLSRTNALPAKSCLAGAFRRDELFQALKHAGFDVTIWEDHTDALRRLTAQLIWSHGSARALWEALGVCSIALEGKPGYFLLVATKASG